MRLSLSFVLTQIHQSLAEAPSGAVPSAGTEAWYADYELRLRPEDADGQALEWRLLGWQFQEDLLNFYQQQGRPPLTPAHFLVTLPEALQAQVLQECPGMMLAAYLLLAQARLSAADCAQATGLFQRLITWASLQVPAATDLQQVSAVLPGWNLEVALGRYLSTRCEAPRPFRCEEAQLDLVVATCREDLKWLSSFHFARIFIYGKCGAVEPLGLPCASYQELPNLAMESLAYAVHLEKHYGHFGKYTLFLQGAPFEHASPQLLQDLASSVQAGVYDVGFLHLNWRRFLVSSSFCLRDLHQRLFDSVAPEAFGSYCCSQFAVRRDRLLSQPLARYSRLRAILLGEVPLACAQDEQYDPRPRIAVSALFEHLWHVTFGEPPVLPPRRSDRRLPLFARLDLVEGALPDVLAR